MDPTTVLDGDAFDEALAELIGTLRQLRERFASAGPEPWVHELDRDLELLERGDGFGLTRFLGHFGSMGSIGDVGVGDAEPLLHRAFLLARVLRRSTTRGDTT